MASQAGITGLVASSLELPNLRRQFGDTIRFVIPGIRPAGAASQDQVRTATPAEAIKAGASYLVVGRPILQAKDPGEAADRVVEEIAAALPRS
jgi:orotidine-5'-phosphate decarboxylase